MQSRIYYQTWGEANMVQTVACLFLGVLTADTTYGLAIFLPAAIAFSLRAAWHFRRMLEA